MFKLFQKKKEGEKGEKKDSEMAKSADRPLELEKKPIEKNIGKTADAYRVLRSPHISEKATDLQGKDKYVFKVWPDANKIEIKKAIEGLYGVRIVDVNIINIHPKAKRLGKSKGFKRGHKKAIVTLVKGQKIEITPH